MSGEFTMDDLVEILQSSIGVDDGLSFDAGLADVPFTEVGYDSLALLELASQLQRRYGLTLPDAEALERLQTPRLAVEYVNDALAAKAG
jgi:act minimal PKS acyl carrier protein